MNDAMSLFKFKFKFNFKKYLLDPITIQIFVRNSLKIPVKRVISKAWTHRQFYKFIP